MSLIRMDDGARINVEADPESSKPALLLSNSLGTDLRLWDPQLSAFRERFRLIRYDSRGHGKSDVPKGPYTIERLGRDAVAILDHFGIERAAFCGLSKGGMVGQWLGVNAPDRLIRLALCDTAARMDNPGGFRERAALVRREGMKAVADGVVLRWFTEPFRRDHPDVVASILATLMATSPEGYAACCEAIADMDQAEAIRAINTPTLVLVGADDPATPPALSEFIHRHIAGSKYVVIPNAAHLTNIEQAAAFNKAVLEFLGGS